MPKILRSIDIVMRIVITICLSIFPLIFLPLLPEYYDTAKFVFLGICACIVLLLFGLRVAVTKQLILPKNSNAHGFAALCVAAIVSVIIASTNRVEALVNPFGAVVFLFLAILISAATLYRDKFIKEWVRWGTIAGAGAVGVLTVYQTLGMGKLLSGVFPYLADSNWTPVGSVIAGSAVFAIVLPLVVLEGRKAMKEKKDITTALAVIAGIAIVGGFVTSIIKIIPQIFTAFLPYTTAWNILLEVYKDPKASLFGVGAENFSNAFAIGKTIAYNVLPVWNTRFGASANSIFHLATTLGIAGIVALVVFGRLLVMPFAWKKEPEWTVSALLALLALVLVPPHMSLFVVIAVLLIIKPHEGDHIHTINFPDKFQWMRFVICAVCVLLAGVVLYGIGRYGLGEMAYAASLRAAQANDAKTTYEKEVQAIQLDPFISLYRTSFAQVNIALAAGITNSVKQQTPDSQGAVKLSDADQKTVAQLVQQGIDQAKVGISLAPNNSLAWETLGRIYQNITGIVQNADTWSVAAYERAVTLDPATPQTRLNLAGAYMAKGDFTSARDQLLVAIQLRGDIANVFYNLAYVYQNLKDYPNEKLTLEKTLTLIDPTSADGQKVKKQLDDAKAQIAPQSENSANVSMPGKTLEQSPLATPAALPKAQVTPKLEITP